MDELVILDFETTGLSPIDSRVLEVGAIIVHGEKIVNTLSQLMDPGCAIPYFITDLTGITNQMVKGKPSPEKFMPVLKKFIGNRPILAHNAPFDKKFLVSEMENIGKRINNQFLCTLNLARKIILDAPDYKLSTLVSHLKIKIPKGQKAHRALSDVMSAFEIWLYIKRYVVNHIEESPGLDFFVELMKQPKNKVLSQFNYM